MLNFNLPNFKLGGAEEHTINHFYNFEYALKMLINLS